MNALWAMLTRPDPTRGGASSHAWELLEYMSRGHRVVVVCGDGGGSPGSREPLALPVETHEVSWLPHSVGRAQLVWEALRGPGNEEFRSVMPGVRAIAAEVRELEEERSFDLVFVWGSDLAPVLRAVRGPTAHYVTDACTTYCQRMVRVAPSVRHKFLYRLDLAHVRRWERLRYREATTLAATSPVDAKVLEELAGRHVQLVPVALNDEWFDTPDRSRARNLVTFVAGLDYWPNRDGICWFLERSWPLVQAQVPEARLRVVGRSPDPQLRGALAREGVDLIADVPDTRPYYWETSVAVLPLRVGAGVKNKLLHAYACGAPVVGTHVAVEGTQTVPGENALVSSDPVDLAAAVVETLSDPERAERRADASRALAEPYRTDLAGRALEALWRSTQNPS